MTPRAAIALALVGVFVVGLGGCYRRVVKAKGFGASRQEVSEPYQESSVIDDWLFGQEPNQKKR